MLIFKVNQDSLGDVILLALQVVSFTEVQELIVRREVSALHLLVSLAGLHALHCLASSAKLSWACGWIFHGVLELL